MKPSAGERETIIRYDESDDHWVEIYTYDKSLLKRLRSQARILPDQLEMLREDG